MARAVAGQLLPLPDELEPEQSGLTLDDTKDRPAVVHDRDIDAVPLNGDLRSDLAHTNHVPNPAVGTGRERAFYGRAIATMFPTTASSVNTAPYTVTQVSARSGPRRRHTRVGQHC